VKDFDVSKPYLTGLEKTLFNQLLKEGDVSFFQTHPCAVCGADIPKVFKYCSKKEYTDRLEALKEIRAAADRIIEDRWAEKEKVRKKAWHKKRKS
jgi:hypothetical protein